MGIWESCSTCLCHVLELVTLVDSPWASVSSSVNQGPLVALSVLVASRFFQIGFTFMILNIF